MKKLLFTGLVFILGIFSGYAQGHTQGATSPTSPSQNYQTNQSVPDVQTQQKYSNLNLQAASLQDLNYQWSKAKKLKQTGAIMSIVGSAVTIGGMVEINRNIFESTGILFVAGFLTTVAAIPIVLTGSGRVANIENAIISRDRDSTVNIQYYNNAKVVRGVGLFLTVVGPMALATAYLLDLNDNSAAKPMYIAGAISTSVGIPLFIVGSKRVNKIVGGLTTHDAASLNIAPSFVYNNKTQNLYPGVTLRVRF